MSTIAAVQGYITKFIDNAAAAGMKALVLDRETVCRELHLLVLVLLLTLDIHHGFADHDRQFGVLSVSNHRPGGVFDGADRFVQAQTGHSRVHVRLGSIAAVVCSF